MNQTPLTNGKGERTMNQDIKVVLLFILSYMMLFPLCVYGYAHVVNKELAIGMVVLGFSSIIMICWMAIKNTAKDTK